MRFYKFLSIFFVALIGMGYFSYIAAATCPAGTSCHKNQACIIADASYCPPLSVLRTLQTVPCNEKSKKWMEQQGIDAYYCFADQQIEYKGLTFRGLGFPNQVQRGILSLIKNFYRAPTVSTGYCTYNDKDGDYTYGFQLGLVDPNTNDPIPCN